MKTKKRRKMKILMVSVMDQMMTTMMDYLFLWKMDGFAKKECQIQKFTLTRLTFGHQTVKDMVHSLPSKLMAQKISSN